MNATKSHVRPMIMTTTSSSQQQKKQRLYRDCIKNQRVLEKRSAKLKADDEWKDEMKTKKYSEEETEEREE